MEKLNSVAVDRELLNKELFIKLNHLMANHIQGTSIPYFNNEKTLYIFTDYDKAVNAEKDLNTKLENLIEKKEGVISAVKKPEITYIGKINKANSNIDMQKDPVEFITTLDVILTNAKFLGIEKVVIDYLYDGEQTLDLEDILKKLEIDAEQPKIIMTEEERTAIANKEIQFNLRFNPIKIIGYINPFSIDNQKGLDLSGLLFDDEADNLEEHLKKLEYNEIAYVSHQIFNEYIPMAKGMENKEMESNFEDYHKRLLRITANKIVTDLKNGKSFFLILLMQENGNQFKIQKGNNGIVPLLYTDFFATNNPNPLCLVNGFDTFKQFVENEKPTALQISAGPLATLLLPIEYIKEQL